jgi:uncharacterized protein (DUF983 family)
MGKSNVEEWFERFGHGPGRLKPMTVEKITHARTNKKGGLRCARCGAQMKLVRRFEKLSASCARCGTASQDND